MSSTSNRRTRRRVLAAIFVAGGAVSSVAAMPADAAVIDNPVISITVTPTNPRLIDPVRTDVVWCVPDSTVAGDTFQIALPPQLTQLPGGFPLRDPNGVVVANASIAGAPAIATFTFNDFVDTHTNVCGTAFFESRLDSSLTTGASYTLTYVVNGTTTFEPVITINPNPAPVGRDTARKGAFFEDPTDECRTVAQSCLAWYIESQLGPLQSVTVTDDGLVGASFECSRLTVTMWSVNASGNLLQAFSPASVGTTVQTSCTPTAFEVVGSNIPANLLMRVVIRATPELLDPLGGVNFTNAATVTHVSQNGAVDADNVNGQRRSARVGGDASGVQLPPTTTTVPPTTTSPPTSTTVVSALPPVPSGVGGPTLPATGVNVTLLGVGLTMFLVGTCMMVAAGRRREVRSGVD